MPERQEYKDFITRHNLKPDDLFRILGLSPANIRKYKSDGVETLCIKEPGWRLLRVLFGELPMDYWTDEKMCCDNCKLDLECPFPENYAFWDDSKDYCSRFEK